MTLLDDVLRDRAELTREVITLARTLRDKAKLAVQISGSCNPLAAAIIGTTTEYYPLTWSNPYQKTQAFATLNTHLRDANASAAVLVFAGTITNQDGSNQRDCINLIIRAPDWQRYQVYPFTVADGAVQWEDCISTASFDTDLIRVPTASQ